MGIQNVKTENNNLNQVEILLVDDREDNLFALESVLQSPSYTLVKVSSGEDALRYLLDNNPALILLDVQMPGLDGFETASIIKQREKSRDIPIIFLTAINKEDRYIQKGYDTGAVDYIFKPFDAGILKSKVAVFADLYRKNRMLLRAEKQIAATELRERERQLAQLELKSLKRQQSEQQKYQDLVAGINHGIVWSADQESLAFSFVSPVAETILGYPLEQWFSEPSFLLNHLPADDQKRVEAQLKNLPVRKSSVSFEHRLIKSDGTEVWFQSGVRACAKEEGNGFELRGLSVEITAIKAAEMELRKNQDRSEFLSQAGLLLAASLDYETTLARVGELLVPKLADWFAIDVLDERGRLKSLTNPAANRQISEFEEKWRKEFVNNPEAPHGVLKVIRTGVPDIFSASLLDANIQGIGFQSAIIVPLIARGRVIGAISLVSLQADSKLGVTDPAIARDLALRAGMAIDNAQLYQQAQQAIRARDEFLSIASHELKTPLTPLKLQTQGMRRSLKLGGNAKIEPERLSKMLEISDKQIGRLSKLVDDLLDISRISVGRLNVEPERFELTGLVQEIVERFSAQLKEANCPVELCAKDPITVEWDKFRIEQVIVNLLTNAMKYGIGKPIRIEVLNERGRIKIEVQDHGIGIALKDQAIIFERFERAVSASRFAGLGLGLYIVAQIITAHGGEISVESELGEGSRFIVHLPPIISAELLENHAAPGALESSAGPGGILHGIA